MRTDPRAQRKGVDVSKGSLAIGVGLLAHGPRQDVGELVVKQGHHEDVAHEPRDPEPPEVVRLGSTVLLFIKLPFHFLNDEIP